MEDYLEDSWDKVDLNISPHPLSVVKDDIELDEYERYLEGDWSISLDQDYL